LDIYASNFCPVGIPVVLFLEISRRTTWPFHIHNPERSNIGRKTYRTVGA
jgi:hypothetical protein